MGEDDPDAFRSYYNNSQMMEKFVEYVNSQDRYNSNGKINAFQ
jgi:hypothetical protein